MVETENYAGIIEDLFIDLRGRGLMLSPRDVDLIDQWRARGIPLSLVVKAIEEVMGNHKGRGVRSLNYCAEEVEAQFTELLERHVGCGGCDKAYCARRAA